MPLFYVECVFNCLFFVTRTSWKKTPTMKSVCPPPRIAICIIAHPHDPTHAHETRRHVMQDCQFPLTPLIVAGLPPIASSSLSGTDSAITAVHAKCVAVMVRHGCVEKKQHVVILEDDCRFHSPSKTHAQLTSNLAALEQSTHGSWWTLHLGHIPLGPTIPITKPAHGENVITWSSLPFTGHAYVINYRVANQLHKSWRKRPFSHEGMLSAPFWSKFAVQPPMATQNRRPKELKHLDQTIWITRLLDFDQWTETMCILGLLMPVLFIWLFASLLRPSTKSKM